MNLVFLLCLLCFGLLSCGPSSSRGLHVLVIAHESFGHEDFSCHKESELSALQALCQESVRFNHAWTTSTASPIALTSILTGDPKTLKNYQHPDTHHVLAEVTTFSESLAAQNIPSALFSAGHPIVSRTGLSQGFEIFEDSFEPPTLFRPFSRLVELYSEWLDDLKSDSSSFAVIYSQDLMQPQRATRDEQRELRPKTYEAQLEEWNDHLEGLISQLKKRGQWDRTWLILVGLNGSGRRPLTIANQNTSIFIDRLRSHYSQVALMIKAPTKPRDLGLSWDIDEDVSLLDLGHSLYSIFSLPAPTCPDCVDLKKVVENVSLKTQNRVLMTSSPWLGQDQRGTLYAFRLGHWLFIHLPQPQYFNSLTDRFEINPILRSSLVPENTRAQLAKVLDEFPVSSPLETLNLKKSESPRPTTEDRLTRSFDRWAKVQEIPEEQARARRLFVQEYLEWERALQISFWNQTNFPYQSVFYEPSAGKLWLENHTAGPIWNANVRRQLKQDIARDLYQIDEN